MLDTIELNNVLFIDLHTNGIIRKWRVNNLIIILNNKSVFLFYIFIMYIL